MGYIVGNMSINNDDNSDNYACLKQGNVKAFYIPRAMNRCSFMEFNDETVELISQGTSEVDNYEYTEDQVNDKIDALKSTVSKYVSDMIDVKKSTDFRSKASNDDKLVLNEVPR